MPYKNHDYAIVPDTFESINVKFLSGGNTGVSTTLFYSGLTGEFTLGDSAAGITGELDTTGGLVKSAKLELTNHIKLNNSAGTSGQVLTSEGENAVPTWTTPTNLSMGSNASASGSGGITINNNNQIIYTPPIIVPSNNPNFTGTVSAGSFCTTGQYAITNNRFKVDTNGYIRISNVTNGNSVAEWDSGSGNIVVTGLYYVSQHFYSDDRIKSNTRDISNATTTLMKLKPVQYEKHPQLIVAEGVEDTDLSGVEYFTESGFVAQEVEKIPELAYMVEEIKYSKDKLKGIKTNDIIPYLVKSVQELKSEIDILKNK